LRTGEGSTTPFLGRLLNLQLRPAQRVIWLGAAWAALCGAVASGKLALTGQSLLSLGLVLFLADPLLGAVWSALEALSQPASSNPGEVRPSEAGAHLPALPYTQPGSASEGFLGRLNTGLAWWRAGFSPRTAASLVDLVGASALALAIGLVLGRWVGLLTAVALILPFLVAALLGQRPLSEPFTRALLEMGLAWLLGYAVFQDLSLPPVEAVLGNPLQASALAWLEAHWKVLLLAGLYTLAYYACLILQERRRLAIGKALLNGPQLAVTVLLVVIRQPILAVLAGLLLISQALFQPLLRYRPPPWYLQCTQFFLMGGMLAAALGARGF
jgi:hypothetical protein